MLEWEDDKPTPPTPTVNSIEAAPDPEVVTPPTGNTDKLEIVSGGRVKESPGLVVFRFNREPTLPELRDMFYAVNDKLA